MPLEEVAACPACGSNAFVEFQRCKDFTTSGELFHVKRCEVCAMVVTSPRPTSSEAVRYYESNEYISHTARSKGLIDSIYLIIRYFTLNWKYSLVKPFLKGQPLLDFGCGTGSFLGVCERRGTKVYGIEPSSEARKQIGGTVSVSDSLESLPAIKFDVITLWHVLEHIYPLLDTLEDLKTRLTQNGTIFIAVPNCESDDALQYGEYWAAYDVPRHIWHFSKQTMSALIQKSGLRIKAILPMKLDAYYISLLSEKNKSGGKLGLFRAVRAIGKGFRSNLRAKEKLNYSSLIYIVEKK